MKHSVAVFISYLDALFNFLRSLWTLTLFAQVAATPPNLMSSQNVINILPSSKPWLKILQVFPLKVTLLIYHTLLPYLNQWRDESANLFQASFSVKVFRNAMFIW